MRYLKIKWLVMLFICGLLLGCGFSQSRAEESKSPQQAAEETSEWQTVGREVEPEQNEPLVQYETEGDLSLGYRWVSSKDNLKAAEFISPHSSLILGVDLLACPLPYRYHLNAELLSKYDYYMDTGFAYKDLVLFRDILVGVQHNLQHFPIQFEEMPGYFGYDERNGDENYYVDFLSNLLSLRLKAPDYPLHAFVNHRHIERDGRVQQRFFRYAYDEPMTRDPALKTSESRDLDWTSDAERYGVNSHLGPIEIEYTYDRSEFEPNGKSFLTDSYSYDDTTPDYSPFHIDEPAGTYSHHVIPETESSAHAVKIHSSYTGGIVTAATLANLKQKNNYSGTESTTWKGAFDFTWIPKPRLSLFFKYRHTDVDMDTPDTVRLTNLDTGNKIQPYDVRQGISYNKDIITLSGRYKPLNILSLYANYKFSYLERKNLDEWWGLIPGHSSIHSIDVKAKVKPLEKLKLTADYEYKNYDQPAYNSTPDRSNKLRLTTTYTPSPTLNIYLEYILYDTKRGSLQYLNSDFSLTEMGFNRDGKQNQFLASLTTELSPKVSLTASWFFQRWRIEQDLAYGKMLDFYTFDQPYIDFGAPYTDKSNSFILSLQYVPWEDITVVAELSHTISKGTTDYADVVGGSPFSLSTFSDVEITETAFSFDIVKRFAKKWEIGLKSYANLYNDRLSDIWDGKIFVSTFNVKRFF
jgi:hypothetical protein